MRKWYPVILVVCAVGISLVAYGRLPARVPVHWDIHGQVNRYGSRLEAAFLTPLIMLGLTVLIPLLPKIDPRGRNYEKFLPTYYLVLDAVITLMFVSHLAVLGNLLGMHISVARVIPAGVGLLLIVLGNVLPRVRPNWMIGIRTPWTLSSDRVWERTHRVGGYLLIGAGLVLLGATALPVGPAAFGITIGAVLAAGLGSVVYSYVAWRQETRS
jgi:uncharacterized membrane protein